ncbi:MAG: permease-like cell division protein FtsX [Muribaculaceae bacterium]|nr:permease-like cell division protein FtsX [Muribaculaceae bacterium]
MIKKKKKGFHIINARVTATVSVALVLIILGIVSFMGIAADNITRDIKENLGFNIVFAEEVSDQEIARVTDMVKARPYAKSVELITPEQSRQRWLEETGEDVMEVIGVNPFAAELAVKVKADYSSTSQLTEFASQFKADPAVDEVTMHAEIAEAINDNLRSTTLVLAVVGVAMLFISFMLINNTVRLTVYSRRFIIHTMKLVGATDSFIRRPFITANILNGVIAGLVASLILSLLLYYIMDFNKAIQSVIPLQAALCVFAGLLLAGIMICGITALIATNRYLRIDYDDMFD